MTSSTGTKSMNPLWAVGGDLIGGIMASKGQKDANKMNLKIARENRDFQERMSSTAYQRSAKDLEKAGLNRILALGNAASSPSGAMATMQNVNTGLAKGVSKAAHSAMALKIQSEQLNLISQQAQNQKQQALTQEDVREQIQANVKLQGAQLSKASAEAEIYELLGPALILLKDAVPGAAKVIQPIIDKIQKRKR